MIDDIYRGLGQEQNSFLSIQSPFYDQTLKGYDYNPEKAKELLLEAGFKYNSDNLSNSSMALSLVPPLPNNLSHNVSGIAGN